MIVIDWYYLFFVLQTTLEISCGVDELYSIILTPIDLEMYSPPTWVNLIHVPKTNK